MKDLQSLQEELPLITSQLCCPKPHHLSPKSQVKGYAGDSKDIVRSEYFLLTDEDIELQILNIHLYPFKFYSKISLNWIRRIGERFHLLMYWFDRISLVMLPSC